MYLIEVYRPLVAIWKKNYSKIFLESHQKRIDTLSLKLERSYPFRSNIMATPCLLGRLSRKMHSSSHKNKYPLQTHCISCGFKPCPQEKAPPSCFQRTISHDSMPRLYWTNEQCRRKIELWLRVTRQLEKRVAR